MAQKKDFHQISPQFLLDELIRGMPGYAWPYVAKFNVE